VNKFGKESWRGEKELVISICEYGNRMDKSWEILQNSMKLSNNINDISDSNTSKFSTHIFKNGKKGALCWHFSFSPLRHTKKLWLIPPINIITLRYSLQLMVHYTECRNQQLHYVHFSSIKSPFTEHVLINELRINGCFERWSPSWESKWTGIVY